MNARFLLPLAAASILAASLSSTAPISVGATDRAVPATAMKVVDLPTVTVRPAAEDLAYYQSNKVVDLATVTVRPEPEDLAHYLASRKVRVADFPVVTVHPDPEDVPFADVGVMRVNPIASR